MARQLVCGKGRVMHDENPEIGFLILLQVVLQPADLLAPEALALAGADRDVVHVRVQQSEMGAVPVERIVGRLHIEELIEPGVVALMVYEDGKEYGFAQQVAFDVEKAGQLAVLDSS